MWSRTVTPLKIEEDKFIFQAMVIEVCASFFFITVFLINTELNSRFFHEPGMRLLVISGAYVTAIEVSRTLAGGSINPAYGIAINLTMLMDTGKGNTLKWIWFYILMPIGGAIIALIFHEFIFKKTQEGIEQMEREDDRVRDEASYIPPSTAALD